MADAEAAEKAANAFIQEVWGLQGAGYAVLALRFFTHFHFARPFAWDDFLMILATVSFQSLLRLGIRDRVLLTPRAHRSPTRPSR